MLINLEFPIDRLIQFITQYNNFINEGEKFYQKFEIILNSYENEKQCETKLPLEYKKLKTKNKTKTVLALLQIYVFSFFILI